MRKALLASLVIWPFLLPGISFADPGAGLWTGCARNSINQSSKSCRYLFTAAVDSEVFVVRSALGATLCFDPDTSTVLVATGQVKIHRAVGILRTDEASFVIENATLTGAAGSECIYDLPSGNYWIEVSTSPAGDDAVVEVTVN